MIILERGKVAQGLFSRGRPTQVHAYTKRTSTWNISLQKTMNQQTSSTFVSQHTESSRASSVTTPYPPQSPHL